MNNLVRKEEDSEKVKEPQLAQNIMNYSLLCAVIRAKKKRKLLKWGKYGGKCLIINIKLLYSPAEHVFWEFITIFSLLFLPTHNTSLRTDATLKRQWQFSYFTCQIFHVSHVEKAINFIGWRTLSFLFVH